jgi:hypothetical protein
MSFFELILTRRYHVLPLATFNQPSYVLRGLANHTTPSNECEMGDFQTSSYCLAASATLQKLLPINDIDSWLKNYHSSDQGNSTSNQPAISLSIRLSFHSQCDGSIPEAFALSNLVQVGWVLAADACEKISAYSASEAEFCIW